MTRGARILYSQAEMLWLEDHRQMIISDYHAAFRAEFGRDDVTAQHLHSLRKRKGWKVGRVPGRFVGRSWKFSTEELAWLEANSRMTFREYHRAFCAAFNRDDISAVNLNGLRKRRGWKTGRTGRFDAGHVPDNKGKKMPFNANCARTQFKKGQLPQNYRGAGHERIVDGYVVMIVAEKNPHTGAATRPVHKHRWLWEKENGPLPDGMVLKSLDGNKLNTDPANWQPVPRGLLPRLNGRYGRSYDAAPATLKPTIMAVAKLEHQVRNKARGAS